MIWLEWSTAIYQLHLQTRERLNKPDTMIRYMARIRKILKVFFCTFGDSIRILRSISCRTPSILSNGYQGLFHCG
jgi:hypothetical protein